MAQIVTITNPLTGQPAQVDQLDHTAQQIDDAIARALPGGGIDTLLAGKAPGGYGYGEVITCYNFTENYSEFTSKLDVILSGMKDGETKQIIIYDASLSYTQTSCTARLLRDNNGSIATLTTDFDKRGQAVVYRKENGIWQPPEYINPPMLIDNEYRTTERYMGNPVYVRLVDCGTLSASSSATEVLVPVATVSSMGSNFRIISCEGAEYISTVDQITAPSARSGGLTFHAYARCWNDSENIRQWGIYIYSTPFTEPYHVYAIVKYTY